MNHAEIIEKMKQKKKAMDWTNEMIAKKSGYNENTIAKFFNGYNTRIHTFMDIVEAMGVEINVI